MGAIAGYFCYAVLNGELTRWKFQVNGELQTIEGLQYYARIEKTKQALTDEEFALSLDELEARYPPPAELKDLRRINKTAEVNLDGLRRHTLSRTAKIEQLQRIGVSQVGVDEIIAALYSEE